MGITTGLEAEAYEAAKLARVSFIPLDPRQRVQAECRRVDSVRYRRVMMSSLLALGSTRASIDS